MLCAPLLLAFVRWWNELPVGPEPWERFLIKDSEPHGPAYPHLLQGYAASDVAEPPGLWEGPGAQGWTPCMQPGPGYSGPPQVKLHYLQVFLDGGLNQQRIGVCDAVAVARLLNATLVVPLLDLNPVWQDPSCFADVFDVAHFIAALEGDVAVVERLPDHLAWSTREYYATGVRATRVKTAPLHAPPRWYLDNVLPIQQRHQVAAIAPFSHRLAFDGLPPDVQKLRCRVNAGALRFVAEVEALGETIVRRMRHRPVAGGLLGGRQVAGRRGDGEEPPPAPRTGAGGATPGEPFLALHLRFDKDMVAHSGCEFGGGWRERRALGHYRRFAWRGRAPRQLVRSGRQLRAAGKCPLTPEEAGLLLAALGFSNGTRLYVAFHRVYGGEARLAPLRRLFPLLQSKESLASPRELAPFRGRASLLAAVDVHVALHSDVFLSASAGNFGNVVAGLRALAGAKKTISPNSVLLARLLADRALMWTAFSRAVRAGHLGRDGAVRARKANQSLFAHPAPDCMCRGPRQGGTYLHS